MSGFFKPVRGSDYWDVNGEHIVKRVPEGTEDAVSRKLMKGKNAGKIVWEIHHEGYEGKLDSVYISKSKDRMFSDKVCLRFDNGAVTIQMPIDGQHARSFIAKVRKIDLDEELKFVPYKMERQDKKDKYNIGVSLYQNGEKLENFIDLKKDGDLPPMIQKKVAGKMEWDSSAQTNYLFDHLVTWIEEQDFPDPKSQKAAAASQERDDSDDGEDEDDEIPF